MDLKAFLPMIASGAVSMIPGVGPFLAPFVGAGVGQLTQQSGPAKNTNVTTQQGPGGAGAGGMGQPPPSFSMGQGIPLGALPGLLGHPAMGGPGMGMAGGMPLGLLPQLLGRR